MKIADPLIFMVYPWGNFKSSYNGQDIEYLLKKVRISGKFNVLPTACVIAWALHATGCPKKNALLCLTGHRGHQEWTRDKSRVSFAKFRKFPF